MNFQYRIENNTVEVFAVGKWRAMRYCTWNHRARRGLIEGYTRDNILRVLTLNHVIKESDWDMVTFTLQNLGR